MEKGKKTTCKKDFYLRVLEDLKLSTNLRKIRIKYNISKQNLHYHLRKLVKEGLIYSKEEGWYEVTEKGKNPTKYGKKLAEDDVRGHAYVWEVEIEAIPKTWKKRIDILRKAEINHILVGAQKSTPRIKVLGRKVWLCNDHIRIFDTKKSSYYGENAKESRKNSKLQAMRIVHALENKLGIRLNPNKIKFKKEHYALIRNQLAIENNNKGVIMRIKDENGNEWLLIDDSLEEGGELENVGKKAFKTNPKLQNWWNDLKNNNFDITATDIKEKFMEHEDFIRKTLDQQGTLMKLIEASHKRDLYFINELEKIKSKQ